MKRVLISFLFLLLSCGKDNVRKSNLAPELFQRVQPQSGSQSEGVIRPQIDKINSAKIQFQGNLLKEFEFPNVVINSEIHFHKKWTYLAKLQKDQSDRQFDFPIDHIDRRLTLLRFHSLNQANQFTEFSWRDFSETSLKFDLNLKYLVSKKLSLRNVQIKLFAVDKNSKRYQVAEAPLLKYQVENEDVDLESGLFSPNYNYQLEFKLKPEMMYQALIGKVWFGLYVANMEVEAEGKKLNYKDLWSKEYNQERSWVKTDKLVSFPGKKEAPALLLELDQDVEYRNDGQVMFFSQTRSDESNKWKILKNDKFQYIAYFSKDDLESFEDESVVVNETEGFKGEGLVEIKGSVQSTSLVQENVILQSQVNQPRVCSRWTRFEKAECFDKDLSCHVTLNRSVVDLSREIEQSDLPGEFIKNRGVFYAHFQDLSKLSLPETELYPAVFGIVGVGHCPSQNEAGFRLPGFSPMSWMGEVGTRFDLKIVVKKPASFQLWF
jgi:hypothetical protein